MLKHFIHILALALPLWGMGGYLHAQSLKDLFLHMPQELCPALSEYNRLELVDNQKNGKPMQTRNLFSMVTRMKALTDNYAYLSVTKNSEKQMKLLTKTDGTKIILMVSTVFSDSIADSSLSFYTTDWQPLASTDFIRDPVSTDFRKIDIDPATDRLTVTTTRPLTLQMDGSLTAPHVSSDSMTYQWDGSTFH